MTEFDHEDDLSPAAVMAAFEKAEPVEVTGTPRVVAAPDVSPIFNIGAARAWQTMSLGSAETSVAPGAHYRSDPPAGLISEQPATTAV